MDADSDGGQPHSCAAWWCHACRARSWTLSHQPQPLYVGLVVLDVALALLWPSAWALIAVPVGISLLFWGAVAPEERYLSTKFGAEYDDYRRRVRRWI
jgi:hypothetical protein